MKDPGETCAARFKSKSSPFRVPLATYRLQLNHEFTFGNARDLTAYLQELGVSDCYLSPIFKARPGSMHGYDVCDSTTLNPELGTREEFNRWTDDLRARGIGVLLDIVPNHMAADPANPWWRDVLENGVNSRYAQWFDIDWDSANPELKGRVLVPILGEHYFKELESGKLRVMLEGEGLELAYYQNRLPLAPGSRDSLEEPLVELCPHDGQIEAVPARLNQGPPGNEPVGEPFHGQRQLAQTRSWNPGKQDERAAVERALRRLNGEPGVPASFNQLHRILQRQHYRLAYWRLAEQQINYRRFFDVTSLVSMRMQSREVFEATHGLTFSLIREGRVTGLRIDHIDGLWNPKQYLEWLQQETAGSKSSLYVVAEKILEDKEEIPAEWPVAGTTGYDFLNQLNGLFIHSANEGPLERLHRQITGNARNFEQAAYAGKKKILESSLRSEVDGLVLRLKSIASRSRYGIDFGLAELRQALVAVIAAFPVYRTYITESTPALTSAEKSSILRALAAPELEHEGADPAVLSFLGQLLLLAPPADSDAVGQELCRDFVMRFQQLTGPVMAKGVEDTAFYNYNRFISLNEVGGDPGRFGESVATFHEQNRRRAEQFPHSLLATSTHDTKRGEDLRARLNVLSEMPQEWAKAVLKWHAQNAGNKSEVNGRSAPDANDEYLLYQTLVGAWEPGAETAQGGAHFGERICNYILKAIRESKAHTQWTEPNLVYEQATRRFIEGLLSDSKDNLFLDDFMLFQRKVAFFGLFNSLAQVVLKLTVPGVPDLYQGSELWDYRLVDPDNRQPVDYSARQRMLFEMKRKLSEPGMELSSFIKGLLKNHQTGQIKMFLIWKILKIRARHARLFERGTYEPIQVVGTKQEHLCAFARRWEGEATITVAARLVWTLAQGGQRAALDAELWQDTCLVLEGQGLAGKYREVLTEQMIEVEPGGNHLAVRNLLCLLPVAVLERLS